MRALVYAAMNDGERADANFRQGLKLTPKDPELNNNYGWYLCQTGRQREAIRYFDVAAADHTYATPAKPLHNAGICLMQVGDDSGAEGYLLKAFKLDPSNAVAMFNLAELYLKRGTYDRAKFYSDRLLSTYQPTAETLYQGIRVAQLGNNTSVRDQLEVQLRNRFPQSPEVAKLDQHGQASPTAVTSSTVKASRMAAIISTVASMEQGSGMAKASMDRDGEMAKASMGKDSDMAPATLNETGLSGTPSTPGPFIAGLGALQPAAGSDHTRAITPADLQSAREARRWTRLDVARQTKFQVRQITALEEGRFDELPGRAFVRAALRNYGQLLGLDVAPLLATVGGYAEPAPLTVRLRYSQAALQADMGAEYVPPGRSHAGRWFFGLAGLAVVIGAGVWFGADSARWQPQNWVDQFLASGKPVESTPAVRRSSGKVTESVTWSWAPADQTPAAGTAGSE